MVLQSQSALSETKQTELNDAIATLQSHKTTWARLPAAQKRDLLKACLKNLGKYAEEWVGVSLPPQGLPKGEPLEGEEWVAGVWPQAAMLRALIDVLDTIAQGKNVRPKKVRTRANGQTVLDVFPHDQIHNLLLHGVRCEVWMQDEVTPHNLDDYIATFFNQKDPVGKVTLVLGAGNVNSIPPMDMLQQLVQFGSVVIVKLNPVNDYLLDVMRKVYAPLIEQGYLYITEGGADIGQYLTDHDGVESIHITGSAKTHDAIVFGTGEEGAARKARNEPRLDKPISSELGGVGPVVVVPGPWTDADFRYQAENIISMKMQNVGFNCVAVQVIVLPEGWDGNQKLMNAIREVWQEVPNRKAYYPGAENRQQVAVALDVNIEMIADDVPRTLITDVDANDKDNPCFNFEFFAPVMAQTSLPAPSTAAYLEAAVAFCNDTLDGTLGANILIHPRTMKELGTTFEKALEDLRYGGIGINGWNAIAFLNVQCPWGAYPGHTIDDVQSGIGTAHNALLLEKSEKTIAYAPFYPFPRSVMNGQFTMWPKPPFFQTNKQAHRVGRQFALFTIDYNYGRLLPLMINALRG